MNKEKKKTMTPRLRFPEFREAGEWDSDKVDGLIETITPPKKLVTANYLSKGKFPIIDQSQSFYCGWTNDDDAIINLNLPLIVFGDHTCILKLAIEPFAQGADGIKIFKPKSKLDAVYLYQYLLFNSVKQEEYKRHFSILREKIVYFPKFDLTEQQKIADTLTTLDELIAAQSEKIRALQNHKKGLMQQMFPAEGETAPRVRFKEFRHAGEWEEKTFGDLIDIKGRIGYRGYTVEDIVKEGEGAIALSPSNINDAGSLSFEKSTYISWFKYEESPEIMLEVGQTILVKTGSSYGKAAFVKELPEKCTINPQLVVLKPIRINSVFLFLLVSHSLIQKQINETVVGGAIPTLSQDSISKFEILVPGKDEQQKIAATLSSLDDLIAAQSEKLEALKAHKKGLMQGLFPNPNET